MRFTENYKIKTINTFILAIILSVTCVLTVYQTPKSSLAENLKYTVVIDAGHGGIDGGVSGINTKIKESEINLSVATYLKEYFEDASISAIMTRETDAGLYGILSPGFKKRDLKKRVEITNKSDAEMFISIHMNKFSSKSKRGAQVFFKNDDKSKTFSKHLQKQLDALQNTSNTETLVGDFYVLNNAIIPAVLVECAYLSNEEDEKLLLTEAYRKELAYSIFKGSISYLYEETQSLPNDNDI